MQLIEFFNTYLLGSCLPPLLLAAGLFFAFRLSFFPLRHPIRTARRLGGGNARSSLSALGVALAGTLGVGNIAGVGVALAVGGEGAVLWMVVSAILASFLKYAEITLALDRKRAGVSRGALDYITPTLGRGPAALFALLMLALALTMGSLLQGQVIAETAATLGHIRPLSVGLVLTALTLLLFLGGHRAVARLSGLLIPPLTLFYTLGALAVVALNSAAIPSALLRILRGAFSPVSAGGGLLGSGVAAAVRAGIGRGLFSNEAGAGTAPFAHGSADVTVPARQGLFGILEVTLDTVLMCTLTALAILTVFDPLPSLSGTALVAAAFRSVFGELAGGLVSISVILFAYATVACWVMYGRQALGHLTERRWIHLLFPLLFSGMLAVGAVMTPAGAWGAADLVLGGMTLINTVALLKNAKRVRTLTEEYGLL